LTPAFEDHARARERGLGLSLEKRVQMGGALLYAGLRLRQALMNVLEMKNHTSESWNAN
jgi:hypothetical protein